MININNKLTINLIFSLLIAIAILFIGINTTFIFTRLLPGDPVLAFLGDRFTTEDYIRELQRLGLDRPLNEQYLRYLADLFTGNWGVSISIDKGQPVWNILIERLPRTLEFSLVPIALGLPLGIRLAVTSAKSKPRSFKNKLIQFSSPLIFAFPIFFLTMVFRYLFAYLIPIFPGLNYKNPGVGDPPVITGFRILDSLISGQIHLVVDTIYHYIMPGLILTLIIIAFSIILTRMILLKNAPNDSIASNTLIIGFIFSVTTMLIILIDISMNFNGFGSILIIALQNSDIWILSGIMFDVILSFAVCTLLGNILFTLNQIGYFKIPNIIWPDKYHNIEDNYDSDHEINDDDLLLKEYLKKKLKSPFTIIGLIIVLLMVVITIIPQIFSPYTFDDLISPWPGQFAPPSLEHPLGQGYLGRDILGRLVYGIRDALFVGILCTLMGLVIGLFFGFIASKINDKLKPVIFALMISFLIFPVIIVVMFGVAIYGQIELQIMLILGIFLTPFFTIIFANTEFKIEKLGKKLITYIPFFTGLTILFYTAIGYLGFHDPSIISLGNDIANARLHLYDAPWGFFWPGITVFLVTAGLFLVYEGFQKNS